MAYPPGSFSKNFAWHGSGLRKLHETIRQGFSQRRAPVRRDVWRQNSGIDEPGLDLIPLNFFLHNSIVDGANFVSVDELVMQAITRDHSALFDRLALFTLHLSRGGQRAGADAGDPRPAMWANEFVLQSLWQRGAWRVSSLTVEVMDEFFAECIDAQPDVQRKVRSNYRHLFELCNYLPSPLDVINTDPDVWGVPALFLLWDRLTLDGDLAPEASVQSLVAAAKAAELHKLLGVPTIEANDLAAAAAQLYIDLGRRERLSAATEAVAAIVQEQADTAVARRTQTVDQQVRNRQIAADLKMKYGNQCMFCGVALPIAVDPPTYFSNASHIQPLGEPHNGPDRTGNMLILCPNHHKQFDHGILRLENQEGRYRIKSKLVGDPLAGRVLELHATHRLDAVLVKWHFDFFTPTAPG